MSRSETRGERGSGETEAIHLEERPTWMGQNNKRGKRDTVEEKRDRKRQRKLGCGLPGSSFYILPIATPKSLIVRLQKCSGEPQHLCSSFLRSRETFVFNLVNDPVCMRLRASERERDRKNGLKSNSRERKERQIRENPFRNLSLAAATEKINTDISANQCATTP